MLTEVLACSRVDNGNAAGCAGFYEGHPERAADYSAAGSRG